MLSREQRGGLLAQRWTQVKTYALTLAEQKQHLAEILDKNQLYVNLFSLNDKDFAVTQEEKKVTKEFYQI